MSDIILNVATFIETDKDGLYPTATTFPSMENASILEIQNATLMRLADVPRTSDDMYYGYKTMDDLTVPLDAKGLARYSPTIQNTRKLMEEGKRLANTTGNTIYCDVFKPIGPQLLKLRGKPKRRPKPHTPFYWRRNRPDSIF